RGYAMARLLSLRDIPVVLGGPHASFLPEEPLQYGDYVIRGEAEKSFPALVDALEHGKDLDDIPNLVYRKDGEIVHNENVTQCPDLDTLPIPDLSLIQGHDNLKIIPALTTRGCPHNCTFCSVTQLFGRRYRMVDTDRLLEQAKDWTDEKVFFCDDNFTAVPSRTKEVLDKMLTLDRVPRGWSAQVRADVYKDEEMMDLMRRTNCDRVYVGYESVDQRVLDNYNKHQTVQEIKNSIAEFHEHDIAVHGMFMFGADHDDKKTFERTTGFASDNQVDTAQFLILTPVPGTELFRKMEEEGRIITHDWSLYDGHHVVFEPERMSPLELQLGTLRANKRFYSARSALRSLSSFRFTTALMRYWGKRILTSWRHTNADFLRKLRQWQKNGRELPKQFSLKKIMNNDPVPGLTQNMETL
ncbi:MAG: B12-binding domain-containing radical SAM protein, partial [Planctomycetota bacterium]